MPLIRSEITVQNFNTEVPRDNSVNVVHHTISDTGFNPAVDYQNHADEIKTLFSGNNTTTGHMFNLYKVRGLTVKVYNMADPTPRPTHAVSTYVPTTWTTDTQLGPRNVSLCLSYYAGRNLPRQRGRIFLGPIDSADISLYPNSIIMANLLDLGHGLFDIGGENVAHVVYSVRDAAPHTISNYWVNNRWDTMRSRLEKETSRVTLAP